MRLFLKSLARYLALFLQAVSSPFREKRRPLGFLLLLVAFPVFVVVQLVHWLTLLLDEPINHLDIPSREQFEQALAGEPVRFDWVHVNAAGDEVPTEIRLVRLPASEARLSITRSLSAPQ